MPQAAHSRPWSFIAGALIAVTGATLVVASRFGEGPALKWTALALVVGGGIELGEGLWLQRRGGAWMPHLFTGVLVPTLAAYLVFATLFDPRAASASPVALLLGIFCIVNALFRGLDLAIDAPRPVMSEAIDAAVTFVLGVVLVANWRSATPAFVALLAGLELFAGGVALLGSARLLWRRPAPSGTGLPGRPA